MGGICVGRTPAQGEYTSPPPLGDSTAAVGGESPYGPRVLKGADIYPRCLFFVEKTTADTTFTAAGTRLFNPRRGSQDKKPWKNLSLVELAHSTV